MATDYWSKVLLRRVSRRRTLAASSATALGAAFLAACGGSSNNNKSSTGSSGASAASGASGSTAATGTSGATGATGASGATGATGATSGLLTKPVNTTAQAKKGGTLKFSVTADIPNFDAQVLSFADAQQVLLNFNRLVKVKPGNIDRADGTIIGDLAESWEFSPDKLTLTMKIRKNAGMPQVAPVNGRNLDANDVVYSWGRWIQNGTSRSDLANSVNANAPILDLTAPDASTVTIKLKSPISSILSSLANQTSGYFFIFPKESDGQVDQRRNPIGGGSYYLSNYTPSSSFTYSRNPNYYDKSLSFADVINVPIVSEYATGLAQLKAGGLHTYTVTSDDILPTKTDVKDLLLYQTDLLNTSVSQFFGFDPAGKTPMRDVRLRQAWSMSMDRQLFIDTFSNVKKFAAAGVPVQSAWNSSALSTAYAGWWLDPQSADFGENAKYYKLDLTTAKQLASAAGFAGGVPVIANQIGGPEYGPVYPKAVEALQGMASAGPFKLDIQAQNYSTNWQPNFRDSHGYFDGVAYRLTPYPADPGEMLYAVYNTGGALYYGFDKDGKGTPKGQPFTGDPTAEQMTLAMRSEFDDSKRKSIAKDLQKYLGGQQYFITELGSYTSFQLAWPTVKNWLAYNTSDFGQYWSSLWLDPTLPPK